MMARRAATLIERLPSVRGSLRAEVWLGKFTWFRVGGAAEVLFAPADAADLADFLAAKPADVPVTVLGVGSNVLVRDGGIDGVVIRLGRGVAEVVAEGPGLRAGAGALDHEVARTAAGLGLAGLEFMIGIPGTVGGALRMNAGAYGREMVDVVAGATALDGAGARHRLDGAELGFGYRSVAVPDDWIFVEAMLRADSEAPEAIAARMAKIVDDREASQPVRTRTGGSTFRNPPGAKAWQLVDRAGCRGLRIGGAVVSEKHCNFLINDNRATADDLEALGEEVRRRVFEVTGVRLEWEIRRIGKRLVEGAGR